MEDCSLQSLQNISSPLKREREVSSEIGVGIDVGIYILQPRHPTCPPRDHVVLISHHLRVSARNNLQIPLENQMFYIRTADHKSLALAKVNGAEFSLDNTTILHDLDGDMELPGWAGHGGHDVQFT